MNQSPSLRTVERKTVFSPCRKYRYTLWREWDCDLLTGTQDDLPNAHKFVQFIGLNPSTADETQDDATIRRCIGFAKAWGYGALCMTNLFAWRETDSSKLLRVEKPIGEDNDNWLLDIGSQAGIVIAAWGRKGDIMGRSQLVCALIPKLHCLRLLKGGVPEHPLYLPANLTPIPFV